MEPIATTDLFETDLEDVVFMARQGLIELATLEWHFQAIVPLAANADIIPQEFGEYFAEAYRRIRDASTDR